jgi:hypothetical protein
LVPNRCWYQKLDHFLGLKEIQKIETKITNRNLPYQLWNFTAAFYSVSLLNNLQIASKKHVQAYFDLTLVPNGSRHQNLDLFLGLIDSNISKLTLPIIKFTTTFYSVSRFKILSIAYKGYAKAQLDPTLVPNGCWDQKMHHFLWSVPPSSCSCFWLAFARAQSRGMSQEKERKERG